MSGGKLMILKYLINLLKKKQTVGKFICIDFTVKRLLYSAVESYWSHDTRHKGAYLRALSWHKLDLFVSLLG